ncbi:hypothetical protein AVEN_2885-1, partial [Araneus ventricosus]
MLAVDSNGRSEEVLQQGSDWSVTRRQGEHFRWYQTICESRAEVDGTHASGKGMHHVPADPRMEVPNTKGRVVHVYLTNALPNSFWPVLQI